MEKERLIENLLTVLPYWHCKIDRPLKQIVKNKMSLETYYCLQILHKNGTLTMSDLAQRLGITKQQATKTIEKLHEYGFVRRIYKEEDRRLIQIEVTQKALDYIEETYYHDKEIIQMLEEKFGEEDLKMFEEAIHILLKILPKLK